MADEAALTSEYEDPPPLGHQAFDVFKDVLMEEMAEENRQLSVENQHLAPVGDALNSTVTLSLLDKRYSVCLREGSRQEDRFVVPIKDVEPIPLLDLAATPPSPVMFSGQAITTFAPNEKLKASLGRIHLGSLGLSMAFEGGRIVAEKDPRGDEYDPRLFIYLSPTAVVSGSLTNVSDDDIADDFLGFNNQAQVRLLMGQPAPINNEDTIVFTVESLSLVLNPEVSIGLEETVDVVVASFESKVLDTPDAFLRNMVNDALDSDDSFCNLLSENVALKSTNRKLLATRERLATIDFRYQGGSLRVALEKGEGRLVNLDGGRTLYSVDFAWLSGDSDLPLLPFNNLRTLRIALGGFNVNMRGMRTLQFLERGIIIVPFGNEVLIVGVLDMSGVEDDFHFPDNNIHQALYSSLTNDGRQNNTLPDEVMFKFISVQFDCSRTRICSTLEILGISIDEDEEDAMASRPPSNADRSS